MATLDCGVMAGRTDVESALPTRGAVVMTLRSIVDVDMVFGVVVRDRDLLLGVVMMGMEVGSCACWRLG